jgi:hypothetical protein
MQSAYGDLDDPDYHHEYGRGYLAGVQSALVWVLGEPWAMVDAP